MKIIDPKAKKESFEPNVDNEVIVTKASMAGIVFLYFSFIFIIPIFWYIGKRNKLIKLQMRINEASSGIAVQLKKRRDTLIKLVDAVKSSIKFEQDLLKDVTKMRSASQSINEQLKTDGNIFRGLQVSLEAYPDIKSTSNIAKLFDAAEEIEKEIAATRRLYNSYINDFNTMIFVWPSSIVATKMKLEKLPLFAISSQEEQDVSLKL